MYMVPFWLIVNTVVDVVKSRTTGFVCRVVLLSLSTLKTRNVPAGTVISSMPWNVNLMLPE